MHGCNFDFEFAKPFNKFYAEVGLITSIIIAFPKPYSAWKVFRFGVISGPYFPVFGLNLLTKIYGVNLRIQSEYRKIRTRNNSVFGHFSCRVTISSSYHSRLLVSKSNIWSPKSFFRFWLFENIPFQVWGLEIMGGQQSLTVCNSCTSG